MVQATVNVVASDGQAAVTIANLTDVVHTWTADQTFNDDVFVGNGNGLVIGHTAQLTDVGGQTYEFQILGTSAADGAMLGGHYSATSSGFNFVTVKGRGTIGAVATVVTGDAMFVHQAFGEDGDEAPSEVVRMSYDCEGSIGAGEVPGRVRWAIAASDGTITERVRFDSSGRILFGDTASPNNDGGLTINQGANDDEILTLQSTSVTNGFTGVSEADTFFRIMKQGGDTGGALLSGLGSGGRGVQIDCQASGTISNTDATNSTGIFSVGSYEDDGSNARQNVAAGNLISFRNGNVTRMILKEDGELHIGNTTLVTLSDSWDDAGLVRAFSYNQADPATLIKSEWDEFVRYNHDDLVEAGIIGRVPDDAPEGAEGLWNISQHLRLLNGMGWQTVEDMMSIAAAMTVEQRGKLTPRMQNRLQALEGRN
jgi:hypothetical protein